MLLNIPQGFAETLEVDDLPFPQKTDWVAHFRVFYDSEDIVVGGAGFLLCCQILKQIGYGIALGLEFTGIKGNPACGLGPDAGGMINIVGAKARCLDLLRGEIPGKLMDDGCHDLQMGQFFGTYICIEMLR